MSNEELNKRMYALVRTWCGQASLAISGVNLADCMAYDALSVIGRQIVNAEDAAGFPPTTRGNDVAIEEVTG